MNAKRRQQGVLMFAILAALEQIDVQAAMGLLPDVTEYRVDPLKLEELIPTDERFSSTFALADLFDAGLADPDLLLVDRISSLMAESKSEIERYITEYHDLYQENPPAFADELTLAKELPPEPVGVKPEPVELAGFEKGLVKAADWSIDMNDKGQLEVDTGLLPKTEIDPRDSTYKSENETLQQALDVVAVVDQLASPIRTGVAENAYNNVTEELRDGRQQ
jgi:hypothetical protein